MLQVGQKEKKGRGSLLGMRLLTWYPIHPLFIHHKYIWKQLLNSITPIHYWKLHQNLEQYVQCNFNKHLESNLGKTA